MIIELGFRYDHDALLYHMGKKGQFEVKLNGELLNIVAEATRAFNLLIPDLELEKNRRK